jgi:ArsR family transcriptional regulator, arsenate/arsenite/antimonite-responsive transcriptional repressor
MAALGEEHRFRLAELIRERPCSVGELVEATGLPQPLVSHHLAVLCAADVARAERQGRRRLYRLSPPENPVVRALVGLLGERQDLPGETEAPPDREEATEAEEIEDYLL